VAKSKRTRPLPRGFSLGEGAAENDGALLREAFYETWIYRAIESREDQKCFIVGRTGSGKSACFRRLEEVHGEHFIRLSPEDLSLPYIADLDVIQKLKSLGVHLDPLFVALWKHVLIVEIIKHRYNVDSPGAKQRILDFLRDKIRRDKSKQQALEYLEEFEGRFWCETDERVREILQKFESRVNAEAAAKLGNGLGSVKVGNADSAMESLAERTEIVNRFQRLVNETQLPRLSRMERVLNEDILDSEQLFTYVAIDDLDRDWADEAITNDLIRCLFRAVTDLKRVENLKVLVALRTNIFESLDFGRTGGQEEKFRALIHHVQWSKSDLRELLDSRAAAAAARQGFPDVQSINDLLPNANHTRGDPFDYIMRRTLLRPRDAISFLNECFKLARGKERLTWKEIYAAEASYSTSRLLALRDEWKPTFPGIEDVLRMFTRASHVMDWSEMSKRLQDCALLVAERDFPGTHWVTRLSEPLWSGSQDTVEALQPLIRLLHNIGFIGCITSMEERLQRGDSRKDERRMVDEPAIYSYDDQELCHHITNLRSVTGFVIHPAFQPSLDILR
jgi:hypothetical protein